MVTFVVLLLLNIVGAQSRLTTYCEPQGGVYPNQRGKREKKELLDSCWAGEEVPILHSGYIHVIKDALGEIDVSPLFTNITTEEMLKKDKLKNEMQRVLQEENYEQAASIKKELFRLRQSSVIPQEAWDSLSEYTDSTQDSCTADSIASKTGRVWKSMVEGMQIFWEDEISLALKMVHHCLKHASKFGDKQLEIILPALISGHDSGKPQPVSLEYFIPEASSFDINRQFKPFFTAESMYNMGGSPTKATSLLSSLSFPYITSSMSTTQNNTIVRLKGASNMVWALGENSGMLHTLSCLTDEWQRRCELYPQYPFGDLAKVTEDHNEPGISWLPWTGVDWFEKVAQKAGALLLAGKLSKTQHRTAIEKVILSGRFYRMHERFERSIEKRWLDAFWKVMHDELAIKILQWKLMMQGFHNQIDNLLQRSGGVEYILPILRINVSDVIEFSRTLEDFLREDEKVTSRLTNSDRNFRNLGFFMEQN